MRKRTLINRRRAGVIVAASLASAASFGILSPGAGAAPETDSIVNDAGTSAITPDTTGTLSNGVSWTRTDVGAFGCGTRTWTFDRPVDVTFGINGLNAPGGGDEGVIVPEAAVNDQMVIDPNHVWNEAQHRVVRGNDNQTATSTFAISDTTEVVLEGGGACGWNRNVTEMTVTYDAPVASIGGPEDGSTLDNGTGTVDFTCADGTGDVTGTATIDGQPVENGDSLAGLEPGTHTLEVTCTDENGVTHTATSTFTVAEPVVPACPEDGLALLNEPGVDIDRTYVLLSGGIHKGTEDFTRAVVDPLTVPLLGLNATDLVHQINCDLVEPLEDVIDSITVPLIQNLGLQGIFKGLF